MSVVRFVLTTLLRYGVKFTETSPGCGHHIDELLVGIVLQLRYLTDMGTDFLKSFADFLAYLKFKIFLTQVNFEN